MRRILICTAALAALVAVPAQAKDKPAKSKSCSAKKVGYNARGTFESHALTQSKGSDTADTSDDRWSGTITVNVTKANHKGLKGSQTLTLTDGRVKFYDAAGDGTADEPQVGDRVGLHGKVSRLGKKCDATGFEPEITLRKIDFKAKKTS